MVLYGDCQLMINPLRDYYNRSGDTQLGVGWMEEDPENGFCVWRVQDEKLILVNVYGNGTHWDTWATEKAKELELDTVLFATSRSPKAFVRKYGYKITGYILEREV